MFYKLTFIKCKWNADLYIYHYQYQYNILQNVFLVCLCKAVLGCHCKAIILDINR